MAAMAAGEVSEREVMYEGSLIKRKNVSEGGVRPLRPIKP